MGGRGATFRIKDKSILDILGHRNEKKTYYIDYGDVEKEVQSSLKNNLTKELENNKIFICSSIEGLDVDVRDMNLIQLGDLSKKYSNIINGYLNYDDLKIRAYKMDRVSLKTGKRTPELETGALFNPTTNQICFNIRNNQNLSQLRQMGKLSQDDGWSVRTDIRNVEKHIVTHEFGHFIENCLIEKRLQKDVRRFKEYKEAENTHNWTKYVEIQNAEASKISTEIQSIAREKFGERNPENLIPSRYAKISGVLEWFAEVFAETNLHTINKPYVKAMEEFLKKESET